MKPSVPFEDLVNALGLKEEDSDKVKRLTKVAQLLVPKGMQLPELCWDKDKKCWVPVTKAS